MVSEIRCLHGKRKSHCKRCEGSQTCIHSRRKQECTDCARSNRDHVINRNICKSCRSKHLSSRRRILGVCATCCHGERHLRIEHVFGGLIVDEVGFEPNLQDEVVSVDHCVKKIASRRPDLVWIVQGTVIVVVEIDEDSHVGYCPRDEVRKLTDQNACLHALQGCDEVPTYTIRVNPDGFDGGIVGQKLRAKTIGKLVRQLLSAKIRSPHRDNLTFAYYHSKSEHLVKEQSRHIPLLEFDRIT